MVGVMSFLPLNELPALFPHVVDWISYLEKQAQIVRPRFQRSKVAPETLQAWIARRLVLRVLHDQVSGSQRCRDSRTIILQAIGQIAFVLSGTAEAQETESILKDFFGQEGNRMSYQNTLVMEEDGR